MSTKVRIYIGAVAFAALATMILLVLRDGRELAAVASVREVIGVLSFSLVALVAEALATNFRVGLGPRQPQSSLAILPFIGSILLFPGVVAVTSIAVVIALSQAVFRRNDAGRILFNVSQGIVCSAGAHCVYFAITGESSYIEFSFRAFAPMVIVLFLSNMILTSIGIALTRDLPFRAVIATVAGPGGANLAYDLLASPIALLPVVLYEATHVAGLFLTVTPLLVLRRSYSTAAELSAANRDLLTVLVKAIETRDPYTSGHSRRVSIMAKAIAQDLGMKGKALADVEQAALLHDIGKIDADYAVVIRKPHDLTADELALIKTHAVRGAELLESLSSVPNSVVEAVRHHHERFDGSGYPCGLAGHEIPVAARVIMVCDSVDAMLSDRPYRKALSMERVRTELHRCAGAQFDPRIVEVVLRRGTLDRAALLVQSEQQLLPFPAMAVG